MEGRVSTCSIKSAILITDSRYLAYGNAIGCPPVHRKSRSIWTINPFMYPYVLHIADTHHQIVVNDHTKCPPDFGAAHPGWHAMNDNLESGSAGADRTLNIEDLFDDLPAIGNKGHHRAFLECEYATVKIVSFCKLVHGEVK